MKIIWCIVPEIQRHDGQTSLSFWAIFCSLTILTTRKIKILKKMKKTTGDIIILHKCTKNHDHMLHYTVPEIWRATDVMVIFHLGLFLTLLPHKPPKKKKLKKKKKKKKWKERLEIIISFYTCTKNSDQMMYGSWDMVRDGRADRRTNERKKWRIDVAAPSKKICVKWFVKCNV